MAPKTVERPSDGTTAPPEAKPSPPEPPRKHPQLDRIVHPRLRFVRWLEWVALIVAGVLIAGGVYLAFDAIRDGSDGLVAYESHVALREQVATVPAAPGVAPRYESYAGLREVPESAVLSEVGDKMVQAAAVSAVGLEPAVLSEVGDKMVQAGVVAVAGPETVRLESYAGLREVPESAVLSEVGDKMVQAGVVSAGIGPSDTESRLVAAAQEMDEKQALADARG